MLTWCYEWYGLQGFTQVKVKPLRGWLRQTLTFAAIAHR